MITPADLILARQRTYQLFSRLYATSLTEDLLPYVAAIPELAALLPEQLNEDQLAAVHYHTFSDTVLPFESVFRDPSGLLFGSITAVVAAQYLAVGFGAKDEPDAISSELAYLAYLGAKEGKALAAGTEAEAARLRGLQREFLQQHLLGWLPPLATALGAGNTPFYSALADLTLALAAEHIASLDGTTVVVADLPPIPDLLHEESTSLIQISNTLLTPPYAGFYLSREAIMTLARKRHLPRGFGKRRQILRNLLETAGQYDSAGQVLADVAEVAAIFAARYEAQLDAWPDLEPWLRPWQKRVAEIQVLLQEMQLLASSGT